MIEDDRVRSPEAHIALQCYRNPKPPPPLSAEGQDTRARSPLNKQTPNYYCLDAADAAILHRSHESALRGARRQRTGMVDRSAAKAVEWSASLASERAMLSQIDAYVGGDGGWASGEVDPDEDDYPSSGGSNGEDFGADDY